MTVKEKQIRADSFRAGWQMARRYLEEGRYEMEVARMDDSLRKWLSAVAEIQDAEETK